MKNMKKGKVPGLDHVTVEMIVASGQMGHCKVSKTSQCNISKWNYSSRHE